MAILTQKSHDIKTKFHAVTTYRKGNNSVYHVCLKYHISKASLMRWNKAFDGSIDSLKEKSRRPLTPHPTAHTPMEINKIQNMIKRNPNIGLTELYTKLKSQANYCRHYCSLYRVLRRIGYYANRTNVRKKYQPKKYHTPEFLGEKMQLDVKFVPRDCNANLRDDYRYFQYTIIDEASRERFLYAYNEHSSFSSIDFLRRAIKHFGFVPRCIQTDNGIEFTHFKETNLVHPFDAACLTLGIIHKTIKPRTPRHNGKVERSHRNDNERFYCHLKFYGLDDLQKQMQRYLYRSNRIGMTPLNFKCPVEKRKELINANKVNYLRLV
jgi:transposase InsO family protein